VAESEALREVFVRFSAEVEGEDKLEHVGEAADKAKEHVQEAGEHAEHSEGLFKTLGETLEGVAAVFAGSELLHGIRETTESLERLSHLSEQTGIATESLQFYGFVVEQAGGSAEEFNSQLSALQRSLSRTDSAVSPQTDALKKLGIETKNASGDARDMNDVLPEIFENFEKLKNPQEEAAVATRLFGKSGLALLPVLREGAKGFEEYRAQFEATGGATPQESIERAKEYEKSIKRLTATFNNLKTHLVTGVLPALTHLVEGITAGTAWLFKFLKGTTASEHAIFALAAAFAGPLLAALAPFLLPGLEFAGIFLAVDDLLAFLEGKDSLIGRLLDAAFGDGTATAVRAWVLDAKNAFLDFFGSAQATFEGLTSANSTFTERALASIVGFVRDASQGFPALTAAFDASLAGMLASLTTFVADALDKWNTFVGALKVDNPILRTVLGFATGGASEVVNKAAGAAQVDTTGLRDTADTLRKRQTDRNLDSLVSLSGGRGFAGSEGTPEEKLATVEYLKRKGEEQRTARVPTTEEGAAQARAGQQFATLGAAHAAGITANVNQDNKVNIVLPPGVSKDSDLAKMVAKEVANALKDNNRTALQQITQRGSK
jgi:hypothetical protein